MRGMGWKANFNQKDHGRLPGRRHVSSPGEQEGVSHADDWGKIFPARGGRSGHQEGGRWADNPNSWGSALHMPLQCLLCPWQSAGVLVNCLPPLGTVTLRAQAPLARLRGQRSIPGARPRVWAQ